jgi:hypothetical protein
MFVLSFLMMLPLLLVVQSLVSMTSMDPSSSVSPASSPTAAAIDAATLSVSQLCISDDGMATVKTITVPANTSIPPSTNTFPIETKTVAPSPTHHIVIDTAPHVKPPPVKRGQKVALAPGHSHMDWMRLVGRLPPPRPRRIAMEEVKLHNKPTDIWVVLYGMIHYIIFIIFDQVHV